MQPGDVIVHYRGGRYLYLLTGTIEATNTPAAIYSSLADGRIWVRPLEEMTQPVPQPGGVCFARFTVMPRPTGEIDPPPTSVGPVPTDRASVLTTIAAVTPVRGRELVIDFVEPTFVRPGDFIRQGEHCWGVREVESAGTRRAALIAVPRGVAPQEGRAAIEYTSEAERRNTRAQEVHAYLVRELPPDGAHITVSAWGWGLAPNKADALLSSRVGQTLLAIPGLTPAEIARQLAARARRGE